MHFFPLRLSIPSCVASLDITHMQYILCRRVTLNLRWNLNADPGNAIPVAGPLSLSPSLALSPPPYNGE